MKKILVLFCSIALLTSCSKDNSGNNSANDHIIGKWYLVEINNAEGFNITANDCNKQSYINFKADNTAESAYYSSDTTGKCTSTISTGDWSKEGDSKYKFAVPVFDVGSQTGRVEFNSDFTAFTFYPDLLVTQNTNIVFEKR